MLFTVDIIFHIWYSQPLLRHALYDSQHSDWFFTSENPIRLLKRVFKLQRETIYLKFKRNDSRSVLKRSVL